MNFFIKLLMDFFLIKGVWMIQPCGLEMLEIAGGQQMIFLIHGKGNHLTSN
jgi:hypothetical protein